jgi:ribulose-phosphate 3-epimerase
MSLQAKIAPSILSADFAKLGDEIKAIDLAGADYIHIDVMDGNFVPNITIGADIVKAIRKYSKKPFDVHLMINNPDLFIEDFAKKGADIITIHAESSIHLDRSLELIKKTGKKTGISLVPSTNENILDYIIEKLDLILVMTVNPGFGGQKFLNSQLKKIENIRKKIDAKNLNIELQVDGGINKDTIDLVKKAGADVFVAGSAIFTGNPADYKKNIDLLR